MKHLKIALPLVLAAALFTSCTKDNNDAILKTAGGSNSSSVMSEGTQKSIAGMPVVTYQITTVPMSANSPLQWTSGYMENSALAFEAIMVNDARCKVSYAANTDMAIKLFGLPDLGNVNVPPARYEDMIFTLKLAPGAGSNGEQGAMALNGSFQAGDMKTRVLLIVDQPIDLSAKWTGGINMNAGAMYRTNLTLSLPALSAGLTSTMLSDASSVDGLITISATSNSAIYQKIMANIDRALTAYIGTSGSQGDKGVTDPGIATIQSIPANGTTGNGSAAIVVRQ